jgi:hypothetical protein
MTAVTTPSIQRAGGSIAMFSDISYYLDSVGRPLLDSSITSAAQANELGLRGYFRFGATLTGDVFAPIPDLWFYGKRLQATGTRSVTHRGTTHVLWGVRADTSKAQMMPGIFHQTFDGRRWGNTSGIPILGPDIIHWDMYEAPEIVPDGDTLHIMGRLKTIVAGRQAVHLKFAGGVWSTELVTIPGRISLWRQMHFGIASDGEFVITFWGDKGNPWTTTSRDRGKTWSPTRPLHPAISGNAQQMRLFRVGEAMYLVWNESVGMDSDSPGPRGKIIHVAERLASGEWREGPTVRSPGAQDHFSLAGTSDGRILAAFVDEGTRGVVIMTWKGGQWVSRQVVPTITGPPTIAVLGDSLHAVWMGSAGGRGASLLGGGMPVRSRYAVASIACP